MTFQARKIDVDLGSGTRHLVTAPGFPDWRGVTPTDDLLVEHAQISEGERVWVYPSGHGALALEVAGQTANVEVTAFDTNWIACEATRRNIVNESNINMSVGLPGPQLGKADVVVLKVPKGRDLVRRLFAGVRQSLTPGGRVLIAGANKQGIKTAIKDAEEVFGAGTVLAYRRGCRVVSFTPSSDNFEWSDEYKAPGILESTRCQYAVQVGESLYDLKTRPGVFSWKKLDDGTLRLLDVLGIQKTDRVLDVGTGCGIIGIHAARLASQGEVVMVDVDSLACECARENLTLNGISNARVVHGDGVAAVAGQKFDLVVSNPPFHNSFTRNPLIARSFIEGAFGVLNKRGRLVLVANRFLKYDDIMTEYFGAVRVLYEDSRYYVLVAEKHYRRPAPVSKEPIWRW